MTKMKKIMLACLTLNLYFSSYSSPVKFENISNNSFNFDLLDKKRKEDFDQILSNLRSNARHNEHLLSRLNMKVNHEDTSPVGQLSNKYGEGLCTFFDYSGRNPVVNRVGFGDLEGFLNSLDSRSNSAVITLRNDDNTFSHVFLIKRRNDVSGIRLYYNKDSKTVSIDGDSNLIQMIFNHDINLELTSVHSHMSSV